MLSDVTHGTSQLGQGALFIARGKPYLLQSSTLQEYKTQTTYLCTKQNRYVAPTYITSCVICGDTVLLRLTSRHKDKALDQGARLQGKAKQGS